MHVEQPVVGEGRHAAILAAEADTVRVHRREPGWTMYMVSHFHYDPVWWNTQGALHQQRGTEDPPGRCRQKNNAFALVAAPEMARRETVYKLRPRRGRLPEAVFRHHPEDREDPPGSSWKGGMEAMGGTYNEPNTNLTGAETSIRNFVHGIGTSATSWEPPGDGVAARRVRPRPAVPGMAADAGLTSSSWARVRIISGSDAERRRPAPHAVQQRVRMDRPRRGLGLLTPDYMPAALRGGHGGWTRPHPWRKLSAPPTNSFESLKVARMTRNVLLPVGNRPRPKRGSPKSTACGTPLPVAVHLRAASASSSPRYGPNRPLSAAGRRRRRPET